MLIELTPKGRDLRASAEQVPAMLSSWLAIGEEGVAELRDRVRGLVDVFRPRLSNAG